jgi:hypothetical protein
MRFGKLLPRLGALAIVLGIAGAAPAAHAQAQARASRHALIIAVGEYVDPAIPTLKGIGYDVESATRMAAAMQVPEQNIRALRDLDATAANVEREIAALNARTRPGDRVFFYFSGHGSRWSEPAASSGAAGNMCVEALLPTDGAPLTNEHLAGLLKPIADKTDKLFVFYDACHSGGIAGQPLALPRSLAAGSGGLHAKFSPAGAPDQCSRPTNIRTRAFTPEAVRQGGLPENIVQISSSRPDEVSFDDDEGGGIATQAWRDCMLGGGSGANPDLDLSGQVSVAELAACAQGRIDKRFANSTQFKAQHITLGGNRQFVPGWFAGSFGASSAQAAPAGDPGAALEDILAQRDPRRAITVGLASERLAIGRDRLELSVSSSHDGYLYLVLLGSDRHSFYLLFPNDVDRGNAIRAGEILRLPRPNWRITAQGPAGTDRLLAVVAASPRDLSVLGKGRAGPFLQSLTDANGRSTLSRIMGTADCGAVAGAGARCSDAYGAALVDVVETSP